MEKPHVVCVIPSRYGAQRLPGKPLIELCGKPMIEWVYKAAQGVDRIDELFVATDDERIADTVKGFGGEVIMTSPDCVSGTDRIAEAMKGRKGDVIVNVQGDEPGMTSSTIMTALQALLDAPKADVSTACLPIYDADTFNNPNAVKVVRAANDVALYFSRSPIPSMARVETPEPEGGLYGYKHLGLYVYRREALEAFVKLDPTALELRERLEQLRFQEIGAQIVCPITEFDSIGVDTKEDVPNAEKLLRKVHKLD